jgi:hypothetical protein
MKMTNKQAQELFFEEEITIDGITYETVEEGDFEQDGKYQTAELIFTDGTKFYQTEITRSGSPFSDWYYEDYGDADLIEVEKKEVTITRWVQV